VSADESASLRLVARLGVKDGNGFFVVFALIFADVRRSFTLNGLFGGLG
jgi:hypothetical protein